MTRPLRRRAPGVTTALVLGPVLGPVLGLGLAGGASGVVPAATADPVHAAAPSRLAPATEAEPLEVRIERLTPSALDDRVRPRDRVVVTGRVVNRSEEPWTDLSAFLLTSPSPMTTSDEIADAVASDPQTYVGDRLLDLFEDLPDLEPGESTRYRLSVPVSQLVISGEPGVYWLQVQVLGTDGDGNRLEGADGRARTFLPLVPRGTDPAELALGLQIRNHTVRAADGRLEFEQGWQQTLAPDGRLGRLVSLLDTAGSYPLSLVVDPAVLDAAESVATGNPALTLEPVDQPDQEQPDPDQPEGESPSPDPEVDGSDDELDLPADEATPEMAAARTWLDELSTSAQGRAVYTLPYGDLDVAAATRLQDSTLLADALALSGAALDERSLPSSPLVAPLPGTLPPAALGSLDPEVPLVLASRFLESERPLRTRAGGGQLLVNDTDLIDGGPAPGDPRAALALRQRLLAEAAVHALGGGDEPLVTLLPPTWEPGPRWQQARFFRGLDVPWIDATPVGDVLARPSSGPFDAEADLAYPERQSVLELPTYSVSATQRLQEAGSTLSDLLTTNATIADRVARQAMLTSSYFSRVRPGLAADRAGGALRIIDSWLAKVVVRAPSFVTMSSESGTFPVTLVNQLDQVVTVGLEITVSGSSLTLTTPDPVELGPRERTAISIDATASGIGIHQVDLQPVTTEGRPVGEPLEVSIRSSRVGLMVWIAMIVGGVVLTGAIVFRILRRINQRRRTRRSLQEAS